VTLRLFRLRRPESRNKNKLSGNSGYLKVRAKRIKNYRGILGGSVYAIFAHTAADAKTKIELYTKAPCP
jgi:hypothetical protein